MSWQELLAAGQPKGQREAIWYGNGTKTKYEYNPKNYRLTRLLTTKSSTVYLMAQGYHSSSVRLDFSSYWRPPLVKF